MNRNNPYHNLPSRQFWKQSVSECHCADLNQLWRPVSIDPRWKVTTGGSCFAQHIGRNLVRRGFGYADFEPAPIDFEKTTDAMKFGYNIFSCRYGNIYTSRQLLHLFEEAFGERSPVDAVWKRDERYFDAMRPGIDPVGQATEDIVRSLRGKHLKAVRSMFQQADVFVFTMGLTEGWESSQDGTMYPTAPGTIAGSLDKNKYSFRNLRYNDIFQDMSTFISKLRSINPNIILVLTVSPVPLIATACDEHVLVANTYSKSVLRAVAGDLKESFENVHYFPSYEIIASHPSRAMFFDADLRTVNEFGVNYVMEHFFESNSHAKKWSTDVSSGDEFEVICDEEKIVS